MHPNEIRTDSTLVVALLREQFPQWADLPVQRVPSVGTDNALYRLGDDLVVRLPRIGWAAGQALKEYEWLPRLAPLLPLSLPVPLAVGEPGAGFPYHWTVCPWLDGENATLDRLFDPHQAAEELAAFISALQKIDPTGGPAPGSHNFGRGVPLIDRDTQTRAAIASLQGTIDADAVNDEWQTALDAPAWHRSPVWIHGDLQSGNLLARGGRLSAVIDFGCLGVGDPACDLMVAWNLLTPGTRETFRAALSVDDATWVRGRGWALSVALIALSYYRMSNPALAAISRYAIDQVMSELG
jgi:aminoglycoside phosphotransferase (APT) family kinase protein